METKSKKGVLAASADCAATPSAPATVKVATNVTLNGAHTYTIKNPDNTAVDVTIEATLEDSEGNRFTDSQPDTCPAKSQKSGTMSSFLTASYAKTGNVLVTARTKITGGVFCNAASGQNMKVV